MTHRVGRKGEVVLPKEMRERAGLYPGSEVEFSLEGNRVVVSARPRGRQLRGRFQGSGMAARLVADRARESG
jgi:AbrB family looped-hinge helix DNA binding protein